MTSSLNAPGEGIEPSTRMIQSHTTDQHRTPERPTTQHTSPLWDYNFLSSIVDGAKSKKEILVRSGLRAAGGNFSTLEKAARHYGIELPVWEPPSGGCLTRVPIESYLVENSTVSRDRLKRRLLEEGILENLCDECGLGDEWNGKPLTLQLDHINGVYNDNRLENLRIICPNCHTQTETFAGKKQPSSCMDCCKIVRGKSKRCMDCHKTWMSDNLAGNRTPKIEWPSIDELLSMLQSRSYVSVANELGVSDNAVRKHLERGGVSPPKRRVHTITSPRQPTS